MAASVQQRSWRIAALAGLGIGAGGLLALYLRRRNAAKRGAAAGKPLPVPQPCHPLWQNIPLVGERVGKKMEHIDAVLVDLIREQKHLGKVFQLKLCAINLVVVCDADAAREIMMQKNYPKSYTYSSLHPFLGVKSMVSSSGRVWAKQRRAFAPGFQFSFLKDLVPTFASKTQLLLDRFAKVVDTGEVISFHNSAVLLTVDIICQIALGVNFGFVSSKEPPELFRLFNELLDTTADYARSPHLTWMRYLPWVYWRNKRIQDAFDAQIIRVIRHRLEESKSSSSPEPDAKAARADAGPRDILGLAIKTAKEGAEQEGGELDLEDVLSQVKTFLFAGHDTTASASAFTVYELSRNPRVEAKMVEEIDRVCGSKPPTSDALSEMKYLSCVVKESLRMWPPGGTARIAPPGTTLQGYDIGGTPMYLPHFPVHRDPDYWGPDADQFRPERWQDEAYVAALHPCCYMPFSKGSRDCIGQVFALLEVKTLLAMLYQRYTFNYAHPEPESQAYRITSQPRHHVPVTVHSRSKK